MKLLPLRIDYGEAVLAHKAEPRLFWFGFTPAGRAQEEAEKQEASPDYVFSFHLVSSTLYHSPVI